ncbi:MAG: tyrosine-type recombinase/integrase, partial [Pseudomonadota bacterium]
YNKVFAALGLPVRSTHTLRHTFATLYTEQTRNRMATQGVLGHSSSSMTDRYAKPTLKAQRDSMEDFLVGKSRPVSESKP